MLLYYFIFIILLFLAYIEILSNNKRFSQGFFFFIIIIFFILSFIRWETGTDWDNYYFPFQRIKIPWESLTDEYSNFELGMMFLYNLAKTLSNSYTMMLFIEGLILYSTLSYAITKYSIYPIFSILMYYTMSLAGIFFVRQNIAMCILLCAIPYIINRKFIKFCLVVIIASLIHRTALFFLIAYPLFYKYYDLKRILFLLIFFTIIGIAIGKILIIYLSSLNLGIITAKLNAYLLAGSNESYTTYSATSVLIRGLINRSFLIVLYLSILEKYRIKDKILNGFINLNLLGVIFYVILTPISFSLGRITAYFDIIQIFILPYLLKKSNYYTKHIFLIILTLYLGFRLFIIISSFPDEYIPYKTILT